MVYAEQNVGLSIIVIAEQPKRTYKAVMGISIDPDQLRIRRKKLMDDISRLQKEADDIDTLLRLADRFSGKSTSEKPKGGKPDLPPRPKGTPTTFEMVEMILASAGKEGKDTITSRELMDEIRAKYWPGVRNSQILPSIFGYAKKGRLTRIGLAWKTIKK